MVRVGLTGELGSGKSTVAHLLAAHGAVVLSSDEIGRAMMQPGQPVYDGIVTAFGSSVVLPDGQLDRPALARLAFDPAHPRVEELNALVHPPVIAEQERLLTELAQTQPEAIAVIESALLFTTRHAGGTAPWRRRFDRIVLVTAPEEQKIERFVSRAQGLTSASATQRPSVHELREEARRRLDSQRIPAAAAQECLVLCNDGTLADLQRQTAALYHQLQREAARHHG